MLNIIVYNHQVLVQNNKNAITLPDSILDIIDFLIPIHVSDTHYVATVTNPEVRNLGNLYFIGLRQALNHFELELAKQIVYFQQLNEYYITHQFCGRCGNKTTKRPINKFVYCENCQTENYPHIAPSIIVRIHHEDKILLARGVNFAPGTYGLIAGFVEIGESLEEAVTRETKEEIGIEIENICYWGSQSWPYPSNSLMTGFTAQYKSGIITPDTTEIEDAGFYRANELPGRPSTKFSIASCMIEDFCITQNHNLI
jgi:NAD+ diphosphatase